MASSSFSEGPCLENQVEGDPPRANLWPSPHACTGWPTCMHIYTPQTQAHSYMLHMGVGEEEEEEGTLEEKPRGQGSKEGKGVGCTS